VVGIVGDVKHWTLQEAPEPELYVPLAQSPSTLINFVVRSNTSETTLAAAVREAIRNVDRQQPVTLTPLRALVSESVAEPRFRSVLFGGFAMIALTLAVVGLYGLISFGVAQRARELGVRVALGAQRDDIMRLVMREGMLIALLGIALGIAGALTLTRLLEEMLYQVRPTDALTFTAVSLLLVVTAAFANYVPARRAAKADPLAALQSE
jgi:putative ABC transport system permease protein